MAFRGVDYLLIDSQFSAKELLVRQTARRFVDERAIPLMRQKLPQRHVSPRTRARNGRAGFPRRQYRRLWLRRHEQRRVRARHAGDRTRRFRPAQLRLRAGRAGDVPDPRPTATKTSRSDTVASAPSLRQGHRLLRAHRAGFRLESGRDAHTRGARRRGLGAERREDLDHQRVDRRCRGRLGAHRRRHSRLPRRTRHARLYHLATFTANGRCARRSLPAFRSPIAGCPIPRCCPA